MESILTSIKKLLGITDEYEHFDADIIMYINSIFPILRELGVGSENGFFITGCDATWNDYISDDNTDISSNDISINELRSIVKIYIYLRVKLLFDPPLTSAVTESIDRTISEIEWRINAMVDHGKEQNT